MNKQRFGFNINCERLGPYTETDVVNLYKRLNASVGLFQDGLGTAQKVYEARDGQIICCVRNDYPDRQLYKQRSGKEQARMWARRAKKETGVVWAGHNEPYGELKDILAWEIECMEECAQLDVGMVSGNWADAATILEKDLLPDKDDKTIWDAWLKTVSRLSADPGNKIYGGHHNYVWGGSMFAGSGNAKNNPAKGYWHWNMLRPELVQTDRWDDRYGVLERNWQGNYVFARWSWLVKRAYHIGAHFTDDETGEIMPYRIIFTEGPFDRIQAWEKDLRELKQAPYEGSYTNLIPRLDQIAWDLGLIERGKKLHGPLDQRHLYPYWYPQWSKERTFIEFAKWRNSIYPAYVVGETMFRLAYDDDLELSWRKNGFNYWDWPELMDLLCTPGVQREIEYCYDGYVENVPTDEQPPVEEPPIIVPPPPTDPPPPTEPPPPTDPPPPTTPPFEIPIGFNAEEARLMAEGLTKQAEAWLRYAARLAQ